MAATFYERRCNLGLAGGCLWLIVVGTASAAWSLLAVRSTLVTVLLVFQLPTTRWVYQGRFGLKRVPFNLGASLLDCLYGVTG
jgi:hypothetical protein